LDIFFMVSSFFAILTSIGVLRIRMKQIKKHQTQQLTGDNPVQIVPSSSIVKHHENNLLELRVRYGANSQEYLDAAAKVPTAVPGPATSSINVLRRTSVHNDVIVENIHAEHRESQAVLNHAISMKQSQQRRHTQLRVEARTQLKKLKTMSKIAAFSTLSEVQIAKIIDVMKLETFKQGDVVCRQDELALKFYVVMSGELVAYVKKKNGSNNPRRLFNEEERRVGDLLTYSFFGENALLGEDAKRNATVKVATDMVRLLVLNKKQFYALLAEGNIDTHVLQEMWREKKSREDSNTNLEEYKDSVVDVKEM